MSGLIKINTDLIDFVDVIDHISSKIDTNEQLREKLIALMSKLNLNDKSVNSDNTTKYDNTKSTESYIHKFIDPRECIIGTYGSKRYYSRFNEETKQHEKGYLLNSYEYTNEFGIKVNLPAIENNYGKVWYINDKKHRVDGPAVEHKDGGKEWCIDNKHHRVDGPAVEYADGYKAWYINGKRHRMDGPAVEYGDRKYWYINGKEYSESDYNDKLKKFIDPRKCIVEDNGDKRYYSRFNEETKQHEEGDLLNSYEYTNEFGIKLNLPAIVHANGKKEWYVNGKLHRIDGPAIEFNNGNKHWYVNDKLHRIDGPAIERADGSKIWYINNKSYSESEYNNEIDRLNKVKKLKDDISKLRSELCSLTTV